MQDAPATGDSSHDRNVVVVELGNEVGVEFLKSTDRKGRVRPRIEPQSRRNPTGAKCPGDRSIDRHIDGGRLGRVKDQPPRVGGWHVQDETTLADGIDLVKTDA